MVIENSFMLRISRRVYASTSPFLYFPFILQSGMTVRSTESGCETAAAHGDVDDGRVGEIVSEKRDARFQAFYLWIVPTEAARELVVSVIRDAGLVPNHCKVMLRPAVNMRAVGVMYGEAHVGARGG